MIYIEHDTHKPIFTSRKKQRELRRRMEPVSQDATAMMLGLVLAMLAILILALIASPIVTDWLSDNLPGAHAESVIYANVSRHSTLNGRAEPSKDSERCARFESGEELTVISYKDGWYEVVGSEYGTCWVSADYVSDAPAAEPAAATVTSNGRVALRDKPDGDRVGWLQNGDTVMIYSTANGWAKIDGGYMQMDYIDYIGKERHEK